MDHKAERGQAGIQTDRQSSPLTRIADASNPAAGFTSSGQLGWAMLGRPGTTGQRRVRLRLRLRPRPGVESSRVRWNRGRRQAARSRTELNRKLCRVVGLRVVWDDSCLYGARSTGSRSASRSAGDLVSNQGRVDVDTCARKQVESTQDPVRCGAVQCAPGPVQSKRPRQLVEIIQDRYGADRGRACALGKRRVKEEEQSQTKPEKLGGGRSATAGRA